jgi:hypothetical protein
MASNSRSRSVPNSPAQAPIARSRSTRTKAVLEELNREIEAKNEELRIRIAQLEAAQRKSDANDQEPRKVRDEGVSEVGEDDDTEVLSSVDDPDQDAQGRRQQAPEQPRNGPVSLAAGASIANAVSSSDAKPPKPPTFEGLARSNVDIWLFEVENYFDAINFPFNRRVSWASALLRETAATWWKGMVKQAKLESGKNANDVIPVDALFGWSQFRSRMVARFQPVEAAKSARQRLLSLRQRNYNGIEAYTNEFQRLLSLIDDMSVADQVNYYIMGLKQDVGRDVKIANPSTISEAMAVASRSSDTFLHPTQSSSSYSANSNGARNYSNNSRQGNSTNAPLHLNAVRASAQGTGASRDRSRFRSEREPTGNGESVKTSSGDNGELAETFDSDQLNFVKRSEKGYRPNPYLSKEEWERLKRENRCFRCKRENHLARDCPLNRSNSRNNGPSADSNPLNFQARRP